MTLSQFKIREIQATDNPKIAQTIREILIEFVVPKAGTDYEDEILDTLFEAYNVKNAIYYILKKKGPLWVVQELANWIILKEMYVNSKKRLASAK